MKNIQNVFQYLQQFYWFCVKLRPNVFTLSFLKVANATLIFLLKDYNVHYILWREQRVNYKMQKDKETNYSVSIVQR